MKKSKKKLPDRLESSDLHLVMRLREQAARFVAERDAAQARLDAAAARLQLAQQQSSIQAQATADKYGMAEGDTFDSATGAITRAEAAAPLRAVPSDRAADDDATAPQDAPAEPQDEPAPKPRASNVGKSC